MVFFSLIHSSGQPSFRPTTPQSNIGWWKNISKNFVRTRLWRIFPRRLPCLSSAGKVWCHARTWNGVVCPTLVSRSYYCRRSTTDFWRLWVCPEWNIHLLGRNSNGNVWETNGSRRVGRKSKLYGTFCGYNPLFVQYNKSNYVHEWACLCLRRGMVGPFWCNSPRVCEYSRNRDVWALGREVRATLPEKGIRNG